jgi:hypothetical protein
MGTEMSCPCGTRPQIKEETPLEDDMDILEKIAKTRLSEDDLLFSKIHLKRLYILRSQSMLIRER